MGTKTMAIKQVSLIEFFHITVELRHFHELIPNVKDILVKIALKCSLVVNIICHVHHRMCF